MSRAEKPRHRRQISAREREFKDDVGKVHLSGMDAHDHETFCGFQWSGNRYEDTSDPVTCYGCLRAAAQARAICGDDLQAVLAIVDERRRGHLDAAAECGDRQRRFAHEAVALAMGTLALDLRRRWSS